jgi:hypothetical protein
LPTKNFIDKLAVAIITAMRFNFDWMSGWMFGYGFFLPSSPFLFNFNFNFNFNFLTQKTNRQQSIGANHFLGDRRGCPREHSGDLAPPCVAA